MCESMRFLRVAILVRVILVAKVGERREANSPLITIAEIEERKKKKKKKKKVFVFHTAFK